MINLRRFPGVLYRYKARCSGMCGAIFVIALTIIYLMHHWKYVCTNREINSEIEKLCDRYEKGEAVGNLCEPLCRSRFLHTISCLPRHSENQIAFTVKWNERLIVIKSAIYTKRLTSTGRAIDANLSQSEEENFYKSRGKIFIEETLEIYPKNFLRTKIGETLFSESSVEAEIRNLVAERLNMSLTSEQLDSLRYLELKDKFMYMDSLKRRTAERDNVFELLQSQEYLLSRLFSDKDVFPQVIGTCGHLYGLEYFDTPSLNHVIALDDKAEWVERMKLAIAIMDFVEIVETDFPDALYLCDVQMRNFGITKSGRIKFLDGTLVFPKSILDKVLKNERQCRQHEDCDLLDCKSTCNMKEAICNAGVVNDNLQAVCEKIFIGLTMSGRILVPGLLMSESTPASLSALLRLCAENRRQSVSEDLRQRLYSLLTEMHQIFMQRLLFASNIK